jgi:hypothetical protein
MKTLGHSPGSTNCASSLDRRRRPRRGAKRARPARFEPARPGLSLLHLLEITGPARLRCSYLEFLAIQNRINRHQLPTLYLLIQRLTWGFSGATAAKVDR